MLLAVGLSRKRCETEPQLLPLLTSRKLHTEFPMVLTSMTLNDFEPSMTTVLRHKHVTPAFICMLKPQFREHAIAIFGLFLSHHFHQSDL